MVVTPPTEPPVPARVALLATLTAPAPALLPSILSTPALRLNAPVVSMMPALFVGVSVPVAAFVASSEPRMPPAKVVPVLGAPIDQVAAMPAEWAARAAVLDEPDSAPIEMVLPPELVFGAICTEPARSKFVEAQPAALKV